MMRSSLKFLGVVVIATLYYLSCKHVGSQPSITNNDIYLTDELKVTQAIKDSLPSRLPQQMIETRPDIEKYKDWYEYRRALIDWKLDKFIFLKTKSLNSGDPDPKPYIYDYKSWSEYQEDLIDWEIRNVNLQAPNVSTSPIVLDGRTVDKIRQYATGMTWQNLCAHTNSLEWFKDIPPAWQTVIVVILRNELERRDLQCVNTQATPLIMKIFKEDILEIISQEK